MSKSDKTDVNLVEAGMHGLARRFLQARIERRNSVMAAPIWILNDLYVDESARRPCVAQALIARGKALAEEMGAQVMSLSTAQDNAPPRKPYEALSFELDGTFCTYTLQLGTP